MGSPSQTLSTPSAKALLRYTQLRQQVRAAKAASVNGLQAPFSSASPQVTLTSTQPANGSRSGSSNCIFTLYVDELDLPNRPEVEPVEDDCEVYVDPMPDESEIEVFLAEFGDVSEIFRLPGSDRGYVVFKDHDAAERCVEAGMADWSESERILASQLSSSKERARTYPLSVVAGLLGPGGDIMNSLKKEAEVKQLTLRGEGLGNRFDATQKSQRVHFWCELGDGQDEAYANERLRPLLEGALADVHERIRQTLSIRSKRARKQALAEADGSENRDVPTKAPGSWDGIQRRPQIPLAICISETRPWRPPGCRGDAGTSDAPPPHGQHSAARLPPGPPPGFPWRPPPPTPWGWQSRPAWPRPPQPPTVTHAIAPRVAPSVAPSAAPSSAPPSSAPRSAPSSAPPPSSAVPSSSGIIVSEPSRGGAFSRSPSYEGVGHAQCRRRRRRHRRSRSRSHRHRRQGDVRLSAGHGIRLRSRSAANYADRQEDSRSRTPARRR